ncbi:flagellar filament capping protein FliD [Nocardioides sp. Bht2]|uniref:flagellar filament capping protein FliD n=1 Tax=Nocardioides sp. Bht2 TaxID=3392297 RepID=UPI0039B5E12A
MPSSSISGLVSGLDTATIINQLMQLEAASQTKLISQLSSAKTSLNSLQTLNSQVAGLATKALALANGSAWSPLKATSSDASVSTTIGKGAVAGNWKVSVDAVATNHRMNFTDTAALTDIVVSPGTTVTLTRDGVSTSIETGDGTLAGLVSALNQTENGLRAATLKLDDGKFALVVTSTETGEDSRFTLTQSDGSALLGGATVTDAQDAAITIEGRTLHSSTNTFTDVMAGVSLTVSPTAVGKTIDLSVTSDNNSATAAVKALVETLNNVIGQAQSLTSYNTANKSSGLLSGDPAVRSLGSSLQGAIYPTDLTSLAKFGLQTDRYGKITFDEEAFNKALSADPAEVAAAITGPNGFASRVESVAKAASDSVDGTLTSAITGRNSSITRLTDSIEAWDTRLALRRTSLERQYTALETALSRMQNQSNWLAGQLNSLSSSSSK